MDKYLQTADYSLQLHLRQILMELNRTVSILFPQYKVPWFHDKFCKEQASRLLSPRPGGSADKLGEDVYSALSKVIGGSQYVKVGSRTRYYHRIEFEFWRHKETGNYYRIGEVMGLGSDG